MNPRTDRTIVGVDEAGRGAWIGPLVVGAVAVAERAVERLREAGARDSKLLSPEERGRVYARIGEIATPRSIELAPREIDRHVAQGRLNDLEARAFGEILLPFSPAVAYVDACDVNPLRFGRQVSRFAGPGIRVIARHRADSIYPLVGAASIVAKVRRDRSIARLARELGADIGSGYPSDERTIRFVRRSVPRDRALPEWLRASWRTTERVIPGSFGRAPVQLRL